MLPPATIETLDAGQVPRLPRPTGRRELRGFFPVVSGILLAGLLVGFGKTFFLRSLFNVPAIPPYLYVHGVVLTTWYVLVLAQTCLVAAHRTDLHRRLGVVAVMVAAMLIPISAFVVVKAVPRMQGMDPSLVRLAIVGDFLTLVVFAGFVAAGVYSRQRSDVHKRLMIASCFVIYGPVFARFDLVYGLPVPPPVVVPLTLLALGAYDFILARRLHRATKGIALVLAGLLLLLGLLIASGVADALIDALR